MKVCLKRATLHRWPIRIAAWAFFYGLSLSLLLATVAVFRFLRVEYAIGYEIHVANATLLSGPIDTVIWLLATAVTTVAALPLATGSRGRERFSWVLYASVAVAEIGLYANGQVVLAYWVSLLLGICFLAATIIPAGQPVLKVKHDGFLMILTGFLVLLLIVEFLALISHVTASLPNIAPPQVLSNTQALQDELSGSLFKYSTILMLAAIFVWIPALPLFLHAPQHAPDPVKEKENEPKRARLVSLILIGLAVALAVILPLLPYLGSLQLRGIDTLFYYQRLSSTSSLGQAIALLGVEPREPYILLLFMVQTLTGWNALRVTIFGPVLLGIFFAATAYLLTRKITEDLLTAGVAAFLSGSSLHVAVGLYAGIYANWLAMSAALLFLYLLDKSLTKPTVVLVLLTTFTSFVVAFIHAWTWAMMLSVALVALALVSTASFRGGRGARGNFIRTRGPVLFLASSPLLVVILASIFGIFQGLTGALSIGFYDVMGSMSLTRLGFVYSILSVTLGSYVGSLLAYPPLLFLAAVGGISIALSELRRERLLVAWLLVTSISAMLLNSWFQWRVLYLIPFELLASVGISSILSAVDWAARRYALGNPRFVLAFKLVLVAVILIDSVNYALRADFILPIVG